MIPFKDERPLSRIPVVTVMLILAVASVYLWQLRLSANQDMTAIFIFGVTPSELFGYRIPPPHMAWFPEFATLITYQFLHGGVVHLLGNLLYLWVFSPAVEDTFGPWRFAILYLVAGIASGLVQAATMSDQTVQIIGASGSISGLLGAYLLLFPKGRIHVLVPVYIVYFKRYRWPAAVFIGFWILIQVVIALLVSPVAGGVAVLAHIVGFGTGMALVPLLRPRK